MAGRTVKLQRGTIYQKRENGTYYFRIPAQRAAQGGQPEKTKNLEAARKEVDRLLPMLGASSLDVVSAHVAQAKFGLCRRSLSLCDAWEVYSAHPEKATPATVSEQQAYEITWREFLEFTQDDQMLVEVD